MAVHGGFRFPRHGEICRRFLSVDPDLCIRHLHRAVGHNNVRRTVRQFISVRRKRRAGQPPFRAVCQHAVFLRDFRLRHFCRAIFQDQPRRGLRQISQRPLQGRQRYGIRRNFRIEIFLIRIRSIHREPGILIRTGQCRGDASRVHPGKLPFQLPEMPAASRLERQIGRAAFHENAPVKGARRFLLLRLQQLLNVPRAVRFFRKIKFRRVQQHILHHGRHAFIIFPCRKRPPEGPSDRQRGRLEHNPAVCVFQLHIAEFQIVQRVEIHGSPRKGAVQPFSSGFREHRFQPCHHRGAHQNIRRRKEEAQEHRRPADPFPRVLHTYTSKETIPAELPGYSPAPACRFPS